MEFRPTALAGVVEIRPEVVRDARGAFVRTFCARTFAEQGMELPTAQMALSHNLQRGTLRGLHVIPEAVGEAKLVRCVRGAIFDVAVDLRRNSPSFGRWTGVELTADNYLALFLPRGVAHGYLTLTDAAEVAYQFSAFHRPGLEKGIRWDDPDVVIAWPFAPTVLSDRDRNLPALADSEFAP
jgi:dTDP-4-dehydrorhamnose 3,5-epimerase